MAEAVNGRRAEACMERITFGDTNACPPVFVGLRQAGELRLVCLFHVPVPQSSRSLRTFVLHRWKQRVLGASVIIPPSIVKVGQERLCAEFELW